MPTIGQKHSENGEFVKSKDCESRRGEGEVGVIRGHEILKRNSQYRRGLDFGQLESDSRESAGKYFWRITYEGVFDKSFPRQIRKSSERHFDRVDEQLSGKKNPQIAGNIVFHSRDTCV